MGEREPIILAEALGKEYELFHGPWERFRCRLGLAPRRALRAVDGVDLRVERGHSLGIVGDNGAGKTTLLRLLAGITLPTVGRCEVRGRVSSILGLGGGFHPELTGRQNIRLSGALGGLEPSAMRELTRDIIAFSELEPFIDEPVKRYSSGMQVRLAFAIAAQARPDVLIVDEALAVGDGRFRKKCLDRVQAFLADGGTLVLCTHSLYLLTEVCQEAIWLREGRVAASGSAVGVAHEYDEHLRRAREPGSPARPGDPDDTARPTIVGLRLLGAAPGSGVPTYRRGERWGLEVDVASPERRLGLHVGLGVNAADQTRVLMCSTLRDGLEPLRGRESYRIRLWLPDLPLASGEFHLHVFLLDETGLHVYRQDERAAAFRVAAPDFYPALIDPPHSWEWPLDS